MARRPEELEANCAGRHATLNGKLLSQAQTGVQVGGRGIN